MNMNPTTGIHRIALGLIVTAGLAIVGTVAPPTANANANADEPASEELVIRLRFAEERLNVINRMHEAGQITPLEVLKAREEAAVLRGRLASQTERLREEIPLLRVERIVREAELKQAQTRLAAARTEQEALIKMEESKAIPPRELALGGTNVAIAESEVQIRQARLREVGLRGDQAEKRLKKLEALSVENKNPAGEDGPRADPKPAAPKEG